MYPYHFLGWTADGGNSMQENVLRPSPITESLLKQYNKSLMGVPFVTITNPGVFKQFGRSTAYSISLPATKFHFGINALMQPLCGHVFREEAFDRGSSLAREWDGHLWEWNRSAA